MQHGLQDIYELDIPHEVGNYLITSQAMARRLDTSPSNRHAREKLLVHEDEEGLNLSLYLDRQVLDHFDRHNPFERLDHGNVQEFCLVLEGISHFLYLVWNATYDRSVTLMEMEIQAEVDKFIMLIQCLERQANAPAAGQLTRLLFDAGVYHEDLSFEEKKRYREAAVYARTYCRRLESRYLGRGDRGGLLAELRKFYRLNKQGKLRRILEPH